MVTFRAATLDNIEAITLLIYDLGYSANLNEMEIRFDQIFSY